MFLCLYSIYRTSIVRSDTNYLCLCVGPIIYPRRNFCYASDRKLGFAVGPVLVYSWKTKVGQQMVRYWTKNIRKEILLPILTLNQNILSTKHRRCSIGSIINYNSHPLVFVIKKYVDQVLQGKIKLYNIFYQALT